jgi:hypothetical protein
MTRVNSHAQLAERLAEERDASRTLDSFPTESARVRHVLFTRHAHGDEWTQDTVAAEANGTSASVSATIGVMRGIGFKFDQRPETDEERRARADTVDGRSTLYARKIYYRFVNPEFNPTESEFNAVRDGKAKRQAEQKKERDRLRKQRQRAAQSQSQARPTAAPATPPKRSNGRGLPPTPMLGETVEVFAVTLEDDGLIRLGVRNQEHAWVVDITGHTLRPQYADA